MFGLGAPIPVGAKTAQKITKWERVSKDRAALLFHLGLQQSSKNQNMLNAHTFSIVCNAKIDKITSFISLIN